MRKIKAIFTNHYVQKFQWPKQGKTYNFDKFTKQIPADRFYKQFFAGHKHKRSPMKFKISRCDTRRNAQNVPFIHYLQVTDKIWRAKQMWFTKKLVNPEITASFQNIKKT